MIHPRPLLLHEAKAKRAHPTLHPPAPGHRRRRTHVLVRTPHTATKNTHSAGQIRTRTLLVVIGWIRRRDRAGGPKPLFLCDCHCHRSVSCRDSIPGLFIGSHVPSVPYLILAWHLAHRPSPAPRFLLRHGCLPPGSVLGRLPCPVAAADPHHPHKLRTGVAPGLSLSFLRSRFMGP